MGNPGDTVSGREFGAFQTIYLENHRALTELLKTSVERLEDGQTAINERIDGVREELVRVNGRVRTTEAQTARLEVGMKAAVEVQLEQKETINETRNEVHQIHEGGCARHDEHTELLSKLQDVADLVVPTAQRKLTTPEKAAIGVAGGGLGLAALWELIHHWSDVAARFFGGPK